jgi:hypothetical protein
MIDEIAKKQDKSQIQALYDEIVEKYNSEIKFQKAILEIYKRARGFEESYHDFVLDLRVKNYRSTSWVRTEEYAKIMRGPLLHEYQHRLSNESDFKVEKVFILSLKSWDKDGVWKWIEEWLTFRYMREDQIRIFVLRETDARNLIATQEWKTVKDTEKYFDMGIYEEVEDNQNPDKIREVVVGFLSVDEQSLPGEYRRVSSIYNDEEVNRAKTFFPELEKRSREILSIRDLDDIKGQPYTRTAA